MKRLIFLLIFSILVHILISNPNDKFSNCHSEVKDTNSITVISTIDGTTIALDTLAGNEIWRFKDKPLLKVSKPINEDFLFLPNPKDGNLFVYKGNKLKILPFTIPQIVHDSPVKTNDGIFFTGAKKDSWLSIYFDRGLQNEEINIFGDDICPVNKNELIHIGKTKYHLTIKNSTNGNSWSITYYDYISYIPIIEEEKPSVIYLTKPGSGKILCIDIVSKIILWEKTISNVVVNIFHLKKDGLYRALNRFVGSETFEAFIRANESDKNMYEAMYNTIIPDITTDEIPFFYYETFLYIGRSKEVMYAIPTYINLIFDRKMVTFYDKNDKLIGFNGNDNNEIISLDKNATLTELNIGYHEAPKVFASELVPILNGVKSKNIFRDTKLLPYVKNGKKIKTHKTSLKADGSSKSTDLNGYKIYLLESVNQYLKMFAHNILIIFEYFLGKTTLYIVSLVVILSVMLVTKMVWKYYEPQKLNVTNISQSSNNSSLNFSVSRNSSYLSTSNELKNNENCMIDGYFAIGKIHYNPQIVLGKGCDGTFVYKGIFEGRNVAVKRVLSELVKITDREIEMLRESDHHVNVIRYFCSESDRSFKYIALELCDCSLASYIENLEHRNYINLDKLDILHQATSGIAHLHHLKIVHRDVKPQNILLSKNHQTGNVRVLISDFGLCKRLKFNSNSISHVSGLRGTEGWMAPETLNGKASVTVFVDIFALGCIYYYVLTDGKHPFGDGMKLQNNILHGYFDLQLISDNDVAVHLIEAMIYNTPSFRPSAISILSHPMFWSNERKLQFLIDVSDRIEMETYHSHIIQALERGSSMVISRNWQNMVCKYLSEDLKKFRPYKYDEIKDLLRAIRNKKCHYRELSDEVKESLGEIPDGFLHYFTSRFPKLLLHIYGSMKICKNETLFQGYYLNAHSAFFKDPFDHLPDISSEFDGYSNSSLFRDGNNCEISDNYYYLHPRVKNLQNQYKSINKDVRPKKKSYIKRW